MGAGDEPDGRQPKAAPFSWRRLAPIGVLVLALALVFAFDLNRYLSLDSLRDHRQTLVDWVAHTGVVAWLVYIAIYAAVVATSVPGGAVMTIAGGFLFGPWLAASLTVVGATAGAAALFLAARYAFAGYLSTKAGPAVRRMEAGFNENAMSYMLFLRLVPVFPFWLVNLVPALLGVRFGTYVVATFVGIIPGTVVFSLVGDGLGAVLDAGGQLDLRIIFEPRFLAPIVGLALLAMLPVVVKRLRRAR